MGHLKGESLVRGHQVTGRARQREGRYAEFHRISFRYLQEPDWKNKENIQHTTRNKIILASGKQPGGIWIVDIPVNEVA